MKFTYFATLLLLTLTLVIGSSTPYKSYSSGSYYFSKHLTVWISFKTVTIYNNTDLSLPPQIYQAEAQLSFAVILSNENILLATTQYIYILNPTDMSVIKQSVLFDRVYVTSGWGNHAIVFYAASTSQLFYMDPQTGNMTLLDSAYSLKSKRAILIGSETLLITNIYTSAFQIKDTSNNLLADEPGNGQPLTSLFGTPYQFFGFVWGMYTIQIWSLQTKTSVFQYTFPSSIYDVWMPVSDRIIIITNDGKFNVYDANFNSLGYILADYYSTIQWNYINDGLIAMLNGNSSVTLFNISAASSSSFYYATLTAPTTVSYYSSTMNYLQGPLFALTSMFSVTIFDYISKTYVDALTFDQMLVPTSTFQYVDGTFFIAYSNQSDPWYTYYLSTCHCSCGTCSGFGPKACTSCYAPKVLDSESSCKWPNNTCDVNQDFCFACGDMVQNSTVPQNSSSSQNNTSTNSTNTTNTTNSSESTNSTNNTNSTNSTNSTNGTSTTNSTNSTNNTTSPNNTNSTNNTSSTNSTNSSSTSNGSSSTNNTSSPTNQSSPKFNETTNTQNVSTQGTGQSSSTINYLTAVNAGGYATMQKVIVSMKKRANINYMLKVQGINTDGRDSCTAIKSAASRNSSASQDDDQPITYQKMSTASIYSNWTYIINLYGLRGSTTYELKVCGDSNNDTDYQSLVFKTKDINYKIAKYNFCLNQQITATLIQDLLCFLKNYLNFPGDRIYSIDGKQCNQLYVGLMASPEPNSQHHRRLLQAANSTGNYSSQNQVGVLLYGNPNTESIDTSVDQAVNQLSTSNIVNLRFQDRSGKYVTVTSVDYQGDAAEFAPTVPNDIVINTSPDSITLSNLEIEGMRGYIYAMLSTDALEAPTQDEIKSSVVSSGNATSSGSNVSNYWYYGGMSPVEIKFSGLTNDKQYVIYYFASNEDITSYAKFSSIVSKTVQTGGSSLKNSTMIVIIVVLSVFTFLMLMTLTICYLRRKRRTMAYKANHFQTKMPAKISNQVPVGEIALQDLQGDKEVLGKSLAGLENSQNVSKLNISNSFEMGLTEGKDLLTSGEFAMIRRKIQSVESKIKEFEQGKLCPICSEHPKDLLLSCGHLICSEKCGKVFSTCPFDQTYIRSRKKIFQSV